MLPATVGAASPTRSRPASLPLISRGESALAANRMPSLLHRLAGPPLASIAILAVVSLCACGIRGATPTGSSVRSGDADELGIISDAMQRVQQDYVIPVDRDKLIGKALKGMLSGLDPHSDYMDRAEYQRLKSDMAGKFAGLGMQITEQNGFPQVLTPIDDTPAARAGIDPGDRIIKIDGQPTGG